MKSLFLICILSLYASLGISQTTNSIVILENNNWEPLFRSIEKTIPSKQQFTVKNLNISNLPVSTNNLIAGDLWWDGSNVRVVLPFNPNNVSNLVLWLDAADTNFMIMTTNSVEIWLDKSSNSRTAYQNTVSSRPMFVANVIGTNSILRFNANKNDSFYGTNWVGIATNLTVFTVALSTNHTASKTAWGRLFSHVGVGAIDDWSGGTTNISSLQGRNSNTTNMYSYINAISFAQVPIISNRMFLMQTLITKTSVSNQINNNAGINTTGNIPDRIYNRFMISASDFESVQVNGYWFGDIAEIIVYQKVLTQDELERVREYLRIKWMLW
jgi:hypothetical protein